MRKIIQFILFFTLFTGFCSAQNMKIGADAPQLKEVRAVWLTTIGGIDWPHSYAHDGMGITSQQNELRDILDKLCDAGINTVLIQTRVRATTIFPSSYEPWDGCLSGKPGVSPGYDGLAFVIEECHKRGMKVHAWIVSIPVGKWNGAGCNNLRKTHPELLRKIGDEGFMNPEKSGTGDYLARFCSDIVARYDIDGIHLDYIRYPDTWGKIADKNAGRKNITSIVRKVHDAVKAQKPWVVMSCSPVGKYADTKRAWSHGWNARDIVCQDAAAWLHDGLMDALFPMMYFRDENFYPFAIDWKERSEGKIIVPGLGIYFMHPREKNWALTDITREMHVSRQYGMGTCFFRSKFFTDNTKNIYNYTRDFYSPTPALQPAMTWINNRAPQAATGLTRKQSNNGIELSWTAPLYIPQGGVQYNIYGSREENVTISAENLLANNLSQTAIALPSEAASYNFAITTTDRYGIESEPLRFSDINKATSSAMHHDVRSTLLTSNGRVYLDNTDAEEAQIIELESLQGTIVATRFIKRDAADRLYSDISSLPYGHYKVFVVTKKGKRHLLGSFFKMF